MPSKDLRADIQIHSFSVSLANPLNKAGGLSNLLPMHLLNLLAYLTALIAFELFISDLSASIAD
jgi:hypothetical protein